MFFSYVCPALTKTMDCNWQSSEHESINNTDEAQQNVNMRLTVCPNNPTVIQKRINCNVERTTKGKRSTTTPNQR